MKDPLIIERKVFIDLIGAAEGARYYLAAHAPATEYANRVRKDINEALPPAVSAYPDPDGVFPAIRRLRYLLALEADTRGQIVPGIKKERLLSPELEEARAVLRKLVIGEEETTTP